MTPLAFSRMEDVEHAFVAAKPAVDIESRRLRASVQQRLLKRTTPALMTLGRYVILRRIGHGGLGVVYAAYDPQLDRRVAIKVVRAEGRTTENNAIRQARLVREARALAKLSHPNVLPVFGTGLADVGLYLVLELVDGVELGQWLEGKPWQRRLAMLLEAGEGLAAAHAVGLVHRDFKPANVLIGDDGRPRVMDFGLVATRSEEPQIAAPHTAPAAAGAFETDDGLVLGTPAYMAPEQHLSEPVDARTDQYAFCVCLYEALFEQHPLGTYDPARLAKACVAGKIVQPASRHEIPAPIVDAILRGLCRSTGDRWPSMKELLDALRRPLRGRRWIRVALISVAAGLAASYVIADARVDRCAAAHARIDGAWSPSDAAIARRSFAATGLPYSDATWARVDSILERFREQWLEVYGEACRAPASESPNPSMTCLELSVTQLRALGETLKAADATVLENAVTASVGLRSPARCREPDRSRGATLPEDPAVREDYLHVRRQFDRVRNLERAGVYDEAVQEARAVLERTRQRQHAPLVAEAHLLLGRALWSSGATEQARSELETAAFSSAALGLDGPAAEALVLLIEIAVTGLGQPSEAQHWARHAEAAVARTRDLLIRADFLSARAVMYLNLAKADAATEDAAEAYEIRIEQLSAEDPAVADAVNLLGRASWARSEPELALVQWSRAVALRRRILGERHPSVVRALNNVGLSLQKLDRGEEAEARLREALDIVQASLGEDHIRSALPHENLGNVLRRFGLRYSEALPHYEKAVALISREHGAYHPRLIGITINLGLTLDGLGRKKEAAARYETAVIIAEQTYGSHHPATSVAHEYLGESLFRATRYEAATDHLRRAHEAMAGNEARRAAIAAKLGGALRALGQCAEARRLLEATLTTFADFTEAARFDVVARAHLELALCDVAQGHDESARAHLRAGLDEPLQVRLRARTRFALAQLIWRVDGDAARSRELGEIALQDFQDEAGKSSLEITQVKTWLKGAPRRKAR